MLNEYVKAKIKEYMIKEMPIGRTLGDFHVRQAFEKGAHFGYQLASEEKDAKIDFVVSHSNCYCDECSKISRSFFKPENCEKRKLITRPSKDEEIKSLQSENARMKEKLEIAVKALEKAKQFCTWLSVDSLKYPNTDAGNAAESEGWDIDQALKQIGDDKEMG